VRQGLSTSQGQAGPISLATDCAELNAGHCRRARGRRLALSARGGDQRFRQLDRVLHHATVVQITGESYRLKDKRRAGIHGVTAREKVQTRRGRRCAGKFNTVSVARWRGERHCGFNSSGSLAMLESGLGRGPN
jgi:hypothetical protein